VLAAYVFVSRIYEHTIYKLDIVNTMGLSSYLALVPRGLEHVALDILQERLSPWQFKLKLKGERPDVRKPESTWFEERAAEKRQKANKRQRSREVIEKTCIQQVGVMQEGTRDIAVGYCSNNKRSQRGASGNAAASIHQVWSEPGQLQGLVWIQVSTDAPCHFVASLRCISSLLVLVDSCAFEEPIILDENQSLEDSVNVLRKFLNNCRDHYFKEALMAWLECVLSTWELPQQQQNELKNKVEGVSSSSIRFRLSCVRDDSKNYRYSRQQLLKEVASMVVPSSKEGPTWYVDLVNYDLEIVLLLRPHAVAVGFSVRPYQLVSAKSFSAGVLPPDVSPPYLSGQILSGVVRLRPSTAQLLLHLAQLKGGEVLLDPCAGIGTIPMETMFLDNAVPVVAMGGDLVLKPQALGPVNTDYTSEARGLLRTKNSGRQSASEFLGLDAGYLPFRDETFDVIVSDLPFGQQCLSSTQLEGLIPLLIWELSRVLRRESGRMVLLCGSFAPILQALHTSNERDDQQIWQLPCSAVFPVNIGGHLAWVVQVRRGVAASVPLTRHVERVRKIVGKREMIQRASATDGKQRRLQS
jgi:Putative RNA methylase family UPF0020